MSYSIILGNKCKSYLKKLKDKQLKKKFIDCIYDEIALNPYIGTQKHGDLANYFTLGFNYTGTAYRIAYRIDDKGRIVIIVLAGSHETFYQTLKRIK